MTAHDDGDNLRLTIVARFLKQARVKAGVTQLDVAQHIGYTTPQFISNWERGVSLPPNDVLPVLCQLYNIPPRSLIAVLERYQDAVVREKKRALNELFAKAKRG